MSIRCSARRWTGTRKLFRRLTGVGPLDVLADPASQARAELLQPAVFLLQVALAEFWASCGVRPDAVVGHSIGRRPALLGSVLAFGAFTAALAAVHTIETLTVLRFLAGLGLGGAMPNAATLASEYVPQRYRPLAVTLTIVSIPLGGALAGELAATLIPTQGWRTLFGVCGAALDHRRRVVVRAARIPTLPCPASRVVAGTRARAPA